MLFLLVVSGITATVVGYRVKSADIYRKNELLETYQALGGTFGDSLKLNRSLALAERFNDKQRVFITAFETNVRTRLHGFPNVLEAIDPTLAPIAIQNLFEIKATEAAKSFRDAWEAYSADLVQAATAMQETRILRSRTATGQIERDIPAEGASNETSSTSTRSAEVRPPLNPTALRYARQYDRYIVRDTELKLFKYLDKNRSAILNPVQ